MEPQDVSQESRKVRENHETEEVLDRLEEAKRHISKAALRYFRALRRERSVLEEPKDDPKDEESRRG